MEKTVIANLEYDLSYKDRPMTFSHEGEFHLILVRTI